MTPKAKRIAVVVGGLAVIGGVLAYLYFKNKKDKELENAKKEEEAKKLAEESTKAPDTTPVTTDNFVPPTTNVPVAPPTKPPSNEADRPMVSATSLLSGGLTLGNKKGLYPNFDGLKVLDMNNNLAFKTQKRKRVGTIYDAKKEYGTIMVYFIGSGGVKLKSSASGMNIK